MTLTRFVNVPNSLSASRLLLLPLLYVFAIRGAQPAFVITYAVLGATDLFDGLAARWLNQKTTFGKTLDSLADLPFYLSSAYFLARLYTQYLRPNRILLYVFFGVLGASFVFAYLKCRRTPLMHSFLLKLVSVLVYFLLILSEFVNTTIFVTVILAIYILGFIEVDLMFLLYGPVDPDTPHIFKLRKKR